jgi:hypothetical protein
VLDDLSHRLLEETGGPGRLGPNSIAGLLKVAQENPDGFRLYFRHAALEPELRRHSDWLRIAMRETAEPYIPQEIAEDATRRWAAQLIPALVIEAIIAWLDAGSPQPNRASDIISGMVAGVTQAITGKPPAAPPTSAPGAS